jgi:hypothetical protein
MKTITNPKNDLKHYLIIGFGWSHLKGYKKTKTT